AAFGDIPQLLQTGDSNRAPVDSLTHTRAAEAIGHPGNVLSMLGPLTGLVCPMVDVAPFFPYFLAGLDSWAWFGGATELVYPQSYIPGLSEIGPWPLQTWGNVYPRIGQITHPENPKAAAVIVQRVADIVTRPLQPHVYTQVGLVPGWPDGNMQVWPPMIPVIENVPTTHRWQMLRPIPGPCEIFGLPDVAAGSIVGWSSGKDSITGDYAFNLWRPYECCRRHRDVFIGRIP
ncbi:MAG TPA: TIGR03756 family integrating conjugative element protein, partial [Rhodospirillales bacterium]|nr:TIGR03756 family integrating conjugative element protein [Rhodospirillales bacterium]